MQAGNSSPVSASCPLSSFERACLELDVLSHVLSLHPLTHLTIPALVQEVIARFRPGDEGRDLESAIRDLTMAGLLICANGLVVPSETALQ